MHSLVAKNLCKSFDKFESRLDYFLSVAFQINKAEKIPVIKDVSFSVRPGETYGILGINGSGKSTIVKMLTGHSQITSGKIEAVGNIKRYNYMTGMIDSYTGFDNIYYKCSLSGMTRKEINEKIEDIITFSELGDDLYKDYRLYSSSMKGKLGFAISINLDADIIVLDGTLAVGDDKFRRKCHDAIYAKLRKGACIIYATHSQTAVENLCQRCLWIDNGEVVCEGNPKKISALYKKYIDGEEKLEDIKYGLKVGRYGIH